MSKAAAIQGTFSGFNIVKGRKVAQLVIEVPIEAADAALEALGGVPRPDAERWVALARLDVRAATVAPEPVRETGRRRMQDLPLPNQVALTCDREAFQRFLEQSFGMAGCIGNAEATAQAVRRICMVTSRSEIQPGTKAAERWRKVNDDFQGWLTQPEYA